MCNEVKKTQNKCGNSTWMIKKMRQRKEKKKKESLQK